MNFGVNLYNWLLSNAQPLVLVAIVVIGFLVVAMLSVGLVFNAAGVKDVLLNLFNQILGA